MPLLGEGLPHLDEFFIFKKLEADVNVTSEGTFAQLVSLQSLVHSEQLLLLLRKDVLFCLLIFKWDLIAVDVTGVQLDWVLDADHLDVVDYSALLLHQV